MSPDGVGDVSDVDRVEVFVVAGSLHKNMKCNVKMLSNVIMVEILIDTHVLLCTYIQNYYMWVQNMSLE